MQRRGDRILTNVATMISAAFPRDAAKRLERELDCSPRQARSITEGRVPGKFRAALIAVLDSAIESNKKHLERLQAELKALDYQAMVSRAADRRASDDRAASADLAEVDRP